MMENIYEKYKKQKAGMSLAAKRGIPDSLANIPVVKGKDLLGKSLTLKAVAIANVQKRTQSGGVWVDVTNPDGTPMLQKVAWCAVEYDGGKMCLAEVKESYSVDALEGLGEAVIGLPFAFDEIRIPGLTFPVLTFKCLLE